MASVLNGQVADQDTFNNAFMSRTEDTDTTGKIALKEVSTAQIDDVQKAINKNFDTLGTVDENDATAKDYSSNNYLSNGDDHKVSLGKVDAQLKVNADNIATNTTDISTINTSKGQPNGLAELDGSGKVPVAQLPDSIQQLLGDWNASTNTPTLIDGVGNTGDSYTVNVAGTQDLGSGNIEFAVGDWVVYSSGGIWFKQINSNRVNSVNTQIGDVVLDADDITETATRYWDVKNNRNAVVAPTVNDDSTANYTVGSTWLDTAADILYICKDASVGAAVWIATGSGGSSNVLFAVVSDQKASGTGGGGFTSGSWVTRDLNTQAGDVSFVSTSANQFTLDAGKYIIRASAPAWNVNSHRIKLVQDPSGAPIDKALGTTEYAENGGAPRPSNRSFLASEVTIGSSTAFEIQHQCSVTEASDGRGIASGFGVNEVYTIVEITKLS